MLSELVVKKNISIKLALKKISQVGLKCLIIVDDQYQVVGTLSDGDIRKGIIEGYKITDSVKSIYNQSPIVLNTKTYSVDTAKKIFLQHRLDIIPIINDCGVLEDCMTWDMVFGGDKIKPKIKATVVIMAGGQGTRLKPFTSILPKPLMPIHDKPVIKHIIDRFHEYGIDDYWVTINHKSNIMKAYFKELEPDYCIKTVSESKPLGTAGSLRLLYERVHTPFFVSNCDVLIQSDYADLLDFHMSRQCDLTIVAAIKHYTLPYGDCEIGHDGMLESIKEKPEYDFLVNTGFYVMNPSVLNMIPKNTYYNMDQLIKDMKTKGKVVGVYPINDKSWVDIGQWDEYKKALSMIEVAPV